MTIGAMGVGDVRAVRGRLGIAIAILFITPRSAWNDVRPIGADPQCWQLLCTAFWRYVAGRLEAVGVQDAEAYGLFPCGERWHGRCQSNQPSVV